MKKQYVLFDLDGTLTDSGEGIMNSVVYALKSYGVAVEDRSSLRAFIGPPLIDSFMKYYGFERSHAEEAVVRYREYFADRGLLENSVYPGVTELLETLQARGFSLMVATSKPEIYTLRILEHFGLIKYFDFVGGATMDEKRTKKADVIRYVLEENHLTNPEEIVMIGDREHDILGAKENGIQSIGVLYGYGDREELETAGADAIAETPGQIANLLE